MRRLVLALLLVTTGCSDGAETVPDRPAALAEDTPIVFLSLDTLRSDRLPVYGYDAVETPAIDRLAADGIVFDHAFSHHPLTLPSHASALTGLLPPDHGIRDNAGYRLADDAPTLAEALRSAGFRTGAAVSAFVMDSRSGLDRGFEVWEDEIVLKRWGQFGSAQRPGQETVDTITPWLREVRDEPFFLFLHFYEPHRPWTPPPDLEARYGKTYEGDIAAADRVVGEFLDLLRELGLYERSLIVLFSDHGEGLGDHGEEEHGVLLHRETLQVPLIVKLPREERGGSRIETPVQLADLPPTVFGLLGIEGKDSRLAGRSLLEPGDPETSRPIYSETYFPRIHFGWSELTSLIEFPHHLILGPRPELYDLRADPEERANLLREERRTFGQLRKDLESYLVPFEAPGEVDPETKRQLAALGYLGGAAGSEDVEVRPDPKTRIPALQSLGEAIDAFESGRFEDAVSGFRRVLEREPQILDAHEYLGHSLMRLHRPLEARRAFEEAVELSGGRPGPLLGLAGALAGLGEIEEARVVAERAARGHPGAYELLAQIALRQDDVESARHYVDEGLRAAGPQPGLRVAEVELALVRGDFESVLSRAEEVRSEIGTADAQLLRGLDFLRGQALANLERTDEALRAFSTEIERHPDFLEPYAHLAFLLAVEGRPNEALQVLKSMVDRNPRREAYHLAADTLEHLGDPAAARRLRAAALERFGAGGGEDESDTPVDEAG